MNKTKATVLKHLKISVKLDGMEKSLQGIILLSFAKILTTLNYSSSNSYR